MITAEVEEYKPFGRDYQNFIPAGNYTHQETELWFIRDEDASNSCEEEIYAHGSVIICSKVSVGAEKRIWKKCFTLDNEIKQIEACTFHGLTGLGKKGSQLNFKRGDVSNCISALGSNCIDMVCEDGTFHATPLPFKVEKIWPLPSGFCVHRSTSHVDARSKKGIPTLFSLVHPLDDFCPIIYRYPESNKSFYFTDSDHQIVFSSSKVPLLITFDTSTGAHTVWKVREATSKDKPDPVLRDDSLLESQQTSKAGNVCSRVPSRLSGSLHIPNGRHSNSPSPSRTRMHTPARPGTPSNAMRMNSPLLNANGRSSRLASPHSAIMHESSFSSDNVFSNVSQNRGYGWISSPLIYRLPSEDSASINEEQDFESMPPTVCLEHIWQEEETSVVAHQKGKADKVFISEDICGQNFICFLLKDSNILKLVELEYRSITSSYFFGIASEIPAKDAGCITRLKMLVVLEPSGDLILYSGVIKICCIDALVKLQKHTIQEESSTALELLRTSYSSEMIDTPRPKQDVAIQQLDIVALRDFTGDKFFAVLPKDRLYRIHVPDITSDELVCKCLEVIMKHLDTESSIKIFARYYLSLNDSASSHQPAEQFSWKKFVDVTLTMMGFPECFRKSMIEGEGNSPAPPQPKRAKKSDSFCENADWEYLQDSGFFAEIKDLFADSVNKDLPSAETEDKEISLNTNTPLYQSIPRLFQGWHLLYEDMKLDVLTLMQRKELASFLLLLSRCLDLESYCSHYSKDFPENMCLSRNGNIHIQKDQLRELRIEETLCVQAKSIENHLVQEITLQKIASGFSSPFKTSQLVIKTLDCITSFISSGITASPDSMISELQISDPNRLRKQDCTEKLLDIFSGAGFKISDLERFPFGLAIIYQELLHHYRKRAPSHLPAASALLLGREDLAAQIDYSFSKSAIRCQPQLFKVRFSCDLRVEEVERLLDSSTPVIINITQKPEVSDHDFIKELESKLFLFSKRTMALPVGRGIYTFGTFVPMIGETVKIPTLELTGRATQSNKVVSLSSQTDLPPDHLQWPSFHNGVAAGLRVAHGSSQIDSTWIVYNKLKYKELNEELAGFMMALGLTGHLHVLPPHLIHDYITKGHGFTSVALLLGIAASKCSSKDADIYKLLAVHVDALLPPTALEISIPHPAKVAAMLGTGLLYMETMERHLVKIFLQEISRPPGPEMENAICRESHSLAAGFALGLVLLGKGTDSLYLSDLKIAQELHHLVFGGQQCELPTYLREIFKSPSYLIKEGDKLNTDITCSSAIMALTLIYLKTNNRVVANWFNSPDTAANLDTIKPDNLLLMLLARGLILWDETTPSIDWIQSQLPEIFVKVSFDTKQQTAYDADEETLRLGYCCVVAGCCMALGIKFAGSMNQAAFNTLMHFTKMFQKLSANPVFERGGKAMVEMCLVTVLLSVSMVMAGTGNLQVLRIARSLRRRSSADISYGTHMAVHMAIGFLFLGGGRFTLSTSNKAIATLLCSLYPKFPHNSKDNRYHLQAFRHLYILACEPRLVIPRDVGTGAICYAPLLVKLKETPSYPATTLKLLAPCFIPEFSSIDEVQITGPRYWPITIKFLDNEDSYDDIIKMIGCLYVKKKVGYLSYKDDPKGHQNLMARTFTNLSEKLETITSFSSNFDAILLGELFCADDNPANEVNTEFLSSILFECVSQEKLDVLQTYISIEKVLTQAANGSFNPENFKQVELVFHFYNILHPKLQTLGVVGKALINENYLIQAQLRLEKALLTHGKTTTSKC